LPQIICITDWSVERSQQLSWVTQTCATKVQGRVSSGFLAHLCYSDQSLSISR